MSFYVEVFDKNDEDNFVGYIGYSNNGNTFEVVGNMHNVVTFDTMEKFKSVFNVHGKECGDYIFNYCWDGYGEDPNALYGKRSFLEEKISKKLLKKRKRKLVKQIKKEIACKGRKRLDNLPQYVRWDVCNTVRCKRNIFTCLIYKDGKVTSTSAFTVYEAMQKVVQNHMKEKKMTAKEALAYLSTYNPDMEKGFTIRKALNRSKVNKEALGITC